MDKVTKVFSNKTIIITITLALTLAYIGLAAIYAEGLTQSTKANGYGRNGHVEIKSVAEQIDPENIHKVKYALEKKLDETKFIIKLLEQKAIEN